MNLRLVLGIIPLLLPLSSLHAAEDSAQSVQVKGAAICLNSEIKEDCTARALTNAKQRAALRGGDTVVSNSSLDQIEARVTVLDALTPNCVRNLDTGNLECEVEILASVTSNKLSLAEREQNRKELLVKLLQKTNDDIEAQLQKIKENSKTDSVSGIQNLTATPEQIAANRKELERLNGSDNQSVRNSLDKLWVKAEAPPLPAGIMENDAVFWKPAYEGNATSQANLGSIYTNGKGVAKDYAKAFYWYQMAANQGYSFAQSNLGMRYLLGQGVTKDANQAALWFRKAADQEFSEAIFNLAVLYEEGNGVEKNPTQAANLYQKAADMGHSDSQTNLGKLYLNGTGVDKDPIKAVSWFRKAAEQGNSNAQINLAVLYSMGLGVEKNIPLVFLWLTKAADQGNDQAQHNLANAYFNGLGGIKDYLLAMNWYKKAEAQNHNPLAQYQIGRLYRVGGFGVNPDPAQAIEWFRKAASQGNNNAIKALQELGVQN
ncbi:MAG: hypothetical protein QM523_02070 [Candidatus Pacebacteria bacterium]|nr:hypothetical protein [Candidatus Paceibacterota bacterium]